MAEHSIKIGSEDVVNKEAIIEFVVDTCINMPNMCMIHLHDDDMKWMDKLNIGDKLEVKVETEFLFKGEITALEPNFKGRISLIVRGYDQSHRLFLNKRTRVFAQQTVKAIASDVAAGLTLKMTSDYSGIEYPYLLQNNQTDMEFLQELAWRLGLNLYVSAEGDLDLRESKGEAPLAELDPKGHMTDFQVRLTAAQQLETVTVWGWNPDEKKGFEVKAKAEKPAHQAGIDKAGGASAKSFNGGVVDVVEFPVAAPATGKEAEALAKALVKRRNSDFLQAEATVTVPQGKEATFAKVRAGTTVEVINAGTKFSGEYFVASARHVERHGEYRLYLELHGGEPNTVRDLLRGRNGSETTRKVMHGPIPALVTDLTDPDKLGRVKVKFHWMTDKGAEVASNWARLVSPMAGKEMGIFYVPEVNDEVLVAFEQGDPNRPYILGALWNKKDAPPRVDTAIKDGHVNELVIQSRSGHVIILEDTKDAEKIIIRDKTGKNSLVISSKENTLTIGIEGDIQVEAKKAISIKSTSGDISLEANNISMKSKQNFTVDATQGCEIKAKQACKVQGMTVSVTNNQAMVDLSGPTVNINNGGLEVT